MPSLYILTICEHLIFSSFGLFNKIKGNTRTLLVIYMILQNTSYVIFHTIFVFICLFFFTKRSWYVFIHKKKKLDYEIVYLLTDLYLLLYCYCNVSPCIDIAKNLKMTQSSNFNTKYRHEKHKRFLLIYWIKVGQYNHKD